MTFLHPAIVWGALLGSIPIIIHILSRRRYRVVRWAAMEFLLSALAERSRSVRLQDLILLALRVLVLVLAALLVARPVLSSSAGRFARVGATGIDAVIIVDTSYSMQTNVGAQTRSALARRRAHDVLAALPAKSRVGVIHMDASAARATNGLIDNRTQVAAAIDAALPSAVGTEAAPALADAVEMLAGSTAPAKRIILVTDAQARAFERSAPAIRDTLDGLDESVGFIVLTVPNEPAPNVAVTDLRARSRWLRVGVPVRFDAELSDVGTPPAREVNAELWVDGRKVDRRTVSMPADRATVTFEHTFTAPGLVPIEVRLDADAIELDSQRYAAVCIPAAIEVAVVGGDPAGAADGKPAYVYIDAALSLPSDAASGSGVPFQVRPATTRDQLAAELDDALRAVVLADPGPLPIDATKRLETWAADGGAVLIMFGPDAAGTVGPFRTGEPGTGRWLANVNVTPPEDRTDDAGPPLQLELDSAGAPAPGPSVIDLESPGVRTALAAVNVFRAVTIEPTDDRAWSVPLRLTDGRPALLVRGPRPDKDSSPQSAPPMALWCTSLDPAWTDLIYRPAIVPLLHDTLLWLVSRRLVSETLTPRAVWARPAGDAVAGLKITLPDGASVEAAGFLELTGPRGEPQLRFDRTQVPGVYLLGAGGGTDRTADALDAVAVNVDTAESDQRVWSAEQIRSLLSADRCEVLDADARLDATAMAGLSGREVWPAAAVLLGLLLLVESLLAFRFSYQARSSRAGAPAARHTQPAGGAS